MCARCEELEERVAYLESELGLMRDAEAEAALHRVFRSIHMMGGGTVQAARMVMVLYQAKGRLLPRYAILDAVPPYATREDERHPKIIDVWLCRARKALGHDAIETVWGKGLRLTEVGRERVRAIIEPMREAA